MGMHGYLYRVDEDRLAELLEDPEQIPGELCPEDFPANIDRQGCSVEKAWNAIEFILDRLEQAGHIPSISPLTEGSVTGAEMHYGHVWYRTPGEVKRIAGALTEISKAEFREGFMPDVMSHYHVYPEIWDEPDQDELFDYVWAWYEPMVRFYKHAAQAGDALLVYLG